MQSNVCTNRSRLTHFVSTKLFVFCVLSANLVGCSCADETQSCQAGVGAGRWGPQASSRIWGSEQRWWRNSLDCWHGGSSWFGLVESPNRHDTSVERKSPLAVSQGKIGAFFFVRSKWTRKKNANHFNSKNRKTTFAVREAGAKLVRRLGARIFLT